ncbi:MAG: ATP-binding protein [Saprospiraceae bacterium]
MFTPWTVTPSQFVDSTEALTFEQVRQGSFQENFQPLDTPYVQRQASGAFWLKTQIIAEDSLTDWLLLLKNPDHEKSSNRSVFTAGNEYVDAWYVLQSGAVDHHRDGFFLPKNQREIFLQPLLNALPISLAAGDTATVFLRVHNPSGSPTAFSLELRPAALKIPFGKSGMSTLMGLSIGVTGILALLCYFFYLAGRDPANLFFSVFCLSLMVHYSIIHPEMLFVSWFVPQRPWLSEYAWVFLTNGSFFWYILFGRSFVNLRQHSILLDRLMLGLAGITVFNTLFSLLEYGFGWGVETGLMQLVVLVLLLLVVRIGFYRNEFAKIFAAGAIWLMIFTILGLLYSAEIFTLFNPWVVGQMGLMVIYTYGLAYKLQLNERAKSDAQRVLELDAVKSRFFANISHEFRTPLTLILGPLKKAQEQLPASDAEKTWQTSEDAEVSFPARHIVMMRRNAERLRQLIDQLLDLSKLENGSMKLQVAAGDVVSFVRAMVFSFESLAERRQIHFQTEFPPAGKMGYFDKDKIEKIIANLLSNAFKYTPERGNVSVKTVLENGRLKVSVEDSGPGISKEELDKIFERFYQVEGTEDKGTGIGLSLVKELVELHRGQISVESASGKGTVFKVSLPVAKESFAEGEITSSKENELAQTRSPIYAAVETEQEPSDQFPHQPSTHPLLLIVEDNPDLRRFIAETMQGEYQIISAENGKEGIEIAIERTPELIVSDVMMPEMDGFELCETLKKDERTSHIPVILLTAKAGQQHKVAGFEMGADAYLTKPFDEQELLVRARNLVEQRRRLQERFSGPSDLANFKKWTQLKPAEVAITSTDQRFLEKVAAAIEANMDNEFFCVEDLAGTVAFSRSQLHRKLKALTGKSANELIRDFRLTRAKELLEKRAGNVSEIAIQVGYNSLSYFTRSFKNAFGVPPSEV